MSVDEEDASLLALQEKLYITEFESLHLKSKLDKVLHTVDCLNDDIADLENANKDKDRMIEELRTQLGQMMTQRTSTKGKIPTKEELKAPIPTGPPKRLWGPPEVRALAEQRGSAGTDATTDSISTSSTAISEDKRMRSHSLSGPKTSHFRSPSILPAFIGSSSKPASTKKGGTSGSTTPSPGTEKNAARGRSLSTRSREGEHRKRTLSLTPKKPAWSAMLFNMFGK
jgi:hypothetical protein